MEYIIKMVCIKDNYKNLKYNDTVWLDNVFGRESFTKNKKDACKFISGVRADKLSKKINDSGNFLSYVVKSY